MKDTFHKNKQGRWVAEYSLDKKIKEFKILLPYWMMHFKVGCILDGQGYTTHAKNNIDFIFAVSDAQGLTIERNGEQPFSQLKSFYEKKKDWLFGFLSYDLKNDVEELSSENPDRMGFPLLHFFSPDIMIQITGSEIKIESQKFKPNEILESIWKTIPEGNCECTGDWIMESRETEEEYKLKIKKIKEHIVEGDLYEMNYCTEFFINSCFIEPAALYSSLNYISKAPFSSFYKWNDKYLNCGSPERFIKKENNKIISQPIKGTASRSQNKIKDEANKNALAQSEKDKAENVMIVDLVRNDLSRSCKSGSVIVNELFGIYGFEHVWQMISTITGELKDDVHFIDAIKALFPMGSMTGAPKIMAMKLIEKYEITSRGLYSGSVGYITPEGDFDFNVVIRSILYNEAQHYLSYNVGGAIVFDSDPESEYQECLLKAKSMRKALGIEN